MKDDVITLTVSERGADFDAESTMCWDVSSVKNMNDMFWDATSFRGDLTRCDVSSVNDMSHMFAGTKFNGDSSEWDVSSVTSMIRMFKSAMSFNQKLCGAAWMYSKGNKMDMFAGSSESIAEIVYTTSSTLAITAIPVFSPQSKSELKMPLANVSKCPLKAIALKVRIDRLGNGTCQG